MRYLNTDFFELSSASPHYKEAENFKDSLEKFANDLKYEDIAVVCSHGHSTTPPHGRGNIPDTCLIFYNWATPMKYSNYARRTHITRIEISEEGGINVPTGTSHARYLSTATLSSRSSDGERFPKEFVQYFPAAIEHKETMEIGGIIKDFVGTQLGMFIEPNLFYSFHDIIHDDNGNWGAKRLNRELTYIADKIQRKAFEPVEVPTTGPHTRYVTSESLKDGAFRNEVEGVITRRLSNLARSIQGNNDNIETYTGKIEYLTKLTVSHNKEIASLKAVDVNELHEQAVNRIVNMRNVIDARMCNGYLYVLTSRFYLGPYYMPNMLLRLGMSTISLRIQPVVDGVVRTDVSYPVPHSMSGASICLGNIGSTFVKYMKTGHVDAALTVAMTGLHSTNSGARTGRCISSYRNVGIDIPGDKEYQETAAEFEAGNIRYIGPNRDSIASGPKKAVRMVNGARVFFTTYYEKLLPRIEAGVDIDTFIREEIKENGE